jgi:predicted MFS family arabinose efflux permease
MLNSRRWLLLAGYVLAVVASQVVWLSFAPITVQTGDALGVSSTAVGDLTGINPLVYALLALPAGRWTDRRFAAALTTGVLLTAAGALLRCAEPTTFVFLLAGQILNAMGQPLVLNATTKLAAKYFPPAQRTVTIAVGSSAQFVGILVASASGEALFDTWGLRTMMLMHAAVAVLAAAAVILTMPFVHALPVAPSPDIGLRQLGRDPVIWRLASLLFIGVGIFNALATWLDPILHGLGADGTAGSAITFMILSGIVGATALPAIAARRNHRRGVLLAATGVTVVALPVIAVLPDPIVVMATLSLAGFLLLAGLPVALEWSELRVGAAQAGTASAFLLCAGNLGGAVLVLMLQLLIDQPVLALLALSAVALPGLLLAVRLPSTVMARGQEFGSRASGAGGPLDGTSAPENAAGSQT